MFSYIVTARKEEYFASCAELPPIHQRTFPGLIRQCWGRRCGPTFRKFRRVAIDFELSGNSGRLNAMESMPLELVLSVLEDAPETDKVHHPYTAFNQGYDARAEHGLPIDVNPYTDERLAAWWKEGWNTADDQEAGEA